MTRRKGRVMGPWIPRCEGCLFRSPFDADLEPLPGRPWLFRCTDIRACLKRGGRRLPEPRRTLAAHDSGRGWLLDRHDAALLAAVASPDRATAWAAYRKSVRDWRERNEAWQREHALNVIGELTCWAVSGALAAGELAAGDLSAMPGMCGR